MAQDSIPLPEPPVRGEVTAQKCACCGHHEIGICLVDGTFVALRPGTRITIDAYPPTPETPE